MSIVPDVAVAGLARPLVRPLQPALLRRLALIEHRNKPNDLALDIVRNALLELRAGATTASHATQTTGKLSSSRAAHNNLRKARGSSQRSEAGHTGVTRRRP